MPCIAGKPDDSAEWYWYHRSADAIAGDRMYGRICTRLQGRTDRNACSSCPAFRGARWDTTIATGLRVDGEPIALTPAEHAGYVAAWERQLEEDDFGALDDWRVRMEMQGIGIGERTLIRIGDPDAMDRWAAYMRERRAAWREAGTTPRRKRTTYMREYMRRRRLLAVSTAGTLPTASQKQNPSRPPARAREARGANG